MTTHAALPHRPEYSKWTVERMTGPHPFAVVQLDAPDDAYAFHCETRESANILARVLNGEIER
jgi:hypothetical protein